MNSGGHTGLPRLARDAHGGVHDIVVDRLVRKTQHLVRHVDQTQAREQLVRLRVIRDRRHDADVEPRAVARDALEARDLAVRGRGAQRGVHREEEPLEQRRWRELLLLDLELDRTLEDILCGWEHGQPVGL